MYCCVPSLADSGTVVNPARGAVAVLDADTLLMNMPKFILGTERQFVITIDVYNHFFFYHITPLLRAGGGNRTHRQSLLVPSRFPNLISLSLSVTVRAKNRKVQQGVIRVLAINML